MNQKKVKKMSGESDSAKSKAAGMPRIADSTDSDKKNENGNRRELLPTDNLCQTCVYSIQYEAGNHGLACYYLIRTKRRRNCPYGLCDKYERQDGNRRNRWKDEMSAEYENRFGKEEHDVY